MTTNLHNQSSHIQTCDQCGLPYGRGGVSAQKDGSPLHFCCYGCSFTNSILGVHGEGGKAGLFLFRLGFSAFLSMNIMALSWAIYDQKWIALGMDAWAVPYLERLLFVLALPVMLVVGWPYLKNAYSELRRRRFSMDSLIALGSFAAFVFSTHQMFIGGTGIYFDTATMTLVLVTAGRYLEAHAKIKTSGAVKQLLELRPDTARRFRNGREEIVASQDVQVGEVINVLPGEWIPLDGVIIEGATSVNESILTGESLPHSKKTNDTVFAATANGEGVINVRVTAASGETVHSHIVRLVEEAQKSRSPIQQQVDRISAIFIPLVIGVSLLTFGGWAMAAGFEVGLLHGLTVLVVACPCALGIGTPLAGILALGKAADSGILVRSTTVLESLARARHAVFDKTGTLTTGALRLWEVRLPESGHAGTQRDGRDFLSMVAALETNSEHPIGRALTNHVRRENIPVRDSRGVAALPGFGIKGEVKADGKWIMVEVGTGELLKMEAEQITESHSDERSATVVYAGWDGSVQGSLTFNDTLRHNARETIELLHSMNIETYLLSGDSKTIAQSVAEAVGIRHAFGKLLPDDKLRFIHDLKSRGVIMVGDGINDAPSLAAADVGITLGSATDIAKESADVTIIGDHLEKIPWLVGFAKRTLRTIRWNIFWAFGYNAVGIILAVLGILDPVVAAGTMIISSLFIILNSRTLST